MKILTCNTKVTETEIQVARNLLTNAKKQMANAINAEEMIKIKAAQLLQNQATAQLENLLTTKESQLKKSAKSSFMTVLLI